MMYNRKKYILIILNIILIITAVASSLQYSRYLKRDEEEKEKEAFMATVESVKQMLADGAEEEKDFGMETGDSVDLTGTRVLIAEDNDLNWEIIQELLSDYHVSCERAGNGQECFDAGMNGHISKPVNMKKVIRVIRTIREERDRKTK